MAAAGDGWATAAPPSRPHPHPQLDKVNALFAAVRDDLEDAAEDAGTTYFPASYDAAHAATHATLAAFEALVASLPPDAASKVRRGSGLKMEQLKAELAALEPH